MALHSSTLAWKIPWKEEPGRMQSMRLLRVRHDRVTSLSLFTLMHWRRKWQPTPVFLLGESQGRWSLVGCSKKRQCQRMLKLPHIALISHASDIMLIFSKPGFSSTWTVNFQMFKLDLEKVEEPEIKLPTSSGSSKKQESSGKHLLLLYRLHQSLWLCGSQIVENS